MKNKRRKNRIIGEFLAAVMIAAGTCGAVAYAAAETYDGGETEICTEEGGCDHAEAEARAEAGIDDSAGTEVHAEKRTNDSTEAEVNAEEGTNDSAEAEIHENHAAHYITRTGTASGTIYSRGRLQYDRAVIDGRDLADIYAYISEKKNTAAGVLIGLGTRFRQHSDGNTYDRNPDAEQEDVDIGQLDWTMLTRAAQESQTVPAGLPVLNPEAAMHIEGAGERTDTYVTAVADNLSLGKAAWADGVLLLGNGADNDRAYRQGAQDNGKGELPDRLCPIYKAGDAGIVVRHVHVGSPQNSEGVSGCYHNWASTRMDVFVCGAALSYKEAVWYPNPGEPEGGSWHGGYYSCNNHNGMYAGPGVCTHEDIVYTTTWNHDVVCGKTDMVYAKLTVSGEDVDITDRAVTLEAALERGSGYGNLAWREGDELIWTDADGAYLGNGPALTVCAPGTYHCSLNVANADIDKRTASVTVTVSGLIVSGN